MPTKSKLILSLKIKKIYIDITKGRWGANMALNYSYNISQINCLNNYISALNNLKKTIQTKTILLNNSCQSTEINLINNAISNLEAEIERVVSNLNSLGCNIKSVANEIKVKEEAAARAAASIAKVRS